MAGNHRDTETQRRPASIDFDAGLLCVSVSLWLPAMPLWPLCLAVFVFNPRRLRGGW